MPQTQLDESQVKSLQTDLAAKMTNPMTAAADLIVGGSGGSPTRLGVGSANQVLTIVGGVLTWATPTSGSTEKAFIVRIGQPAAGNMSGALPAPGVTGNLTLQRARVTMDGSGSASAFTFDIEIHNTGTGSFSAALTSRVTVASSTADSGDITAATSGTAFGSMVIGNGTHATRLRLNGITVPGDITGLVIELVFA